MTPVEIPRSNRRVWTEEGRVTLAEEADAWLEKFVGHRQFRGLDQPEYHPRRDHWLILNSFHSLNNNHGTRIFFSNPGHAAMFKLTFL